MEDYVKGTLGSDTFDKWLYAADTTVNSISYFALEDGSYCLAYYYGDGNPTWKVVVKNTIIGEDYSAYGETMAATYAVTQKDRALKQVEA